MRSSGSGAWRFLWPWVVGFAVLTLIPLAASLVLSLCETGLQSGSLRTTWNGGDHYVNALGPGRSAKSAATDPWCWRAFGGRPNDPRFYKSLSNSLFYTAFAVPLNLMVSLAVALLLNRRFRGAALARTLVYLPHVLGGAATIVIWSWMLNPQFGCVNQIIRALYAALDPLIRLFSASGTANWFVPDWLYSPSWCKPALILMHAWTMGGSMLVFLAALRRMDARLHDAAALDGASAWRRFRHVTWPQITPAVLFNLIVSTVFAMQAFTEPYMLQNRRQEEGLLFFVPYLYETAFEGSHQLGYASAMAWIFLVLLCIITAPLILSSRRWVYYAATD